MPSDKNGSAITDARIYHDESEMRIAVRWANDEEIDRPLADFVADALRAEGTPRTAELAMSPLCAAEGCQLCGIDQAEPAPEGTAPESAPSAIERATPEMADAVRGVLQILRGKPGATFADVLAHCDSAGYDWDRWPAWIKEQKGYVTEQAAAMMIYDIMHSTSTGAK